MDSRAVLLSQIDTLQRGLGQAARAVDLPGLDDRLRGRVEHLRMRMHYRFHNLFAQQTQALEQLAGDVQSDSDLAHCWNRFHQIDIECRRLFRESLALVEGTIVRACGLDAGLCELADGVLRTLGRQADVRWDRFTILADTDTYTDMTEIIRVRFPDPAIWSLPIVAHELGHFIARNLKLPNDDGVTYRQALTDVIQQFSVSRQHVDEFFADSFAAYTMGPAYACTCIISQFNPRFAFHLDDLHPAFADRALILFRTLLAMDRGRLMPAHAGIVAFLQQLWQSGIAASGLRRNEAAEASSDLCSLGDRLYDLVALMPAARFGGWDAAPALAAKLGAREFAANQVARDQSVISVLNAAWLARLDPQFRDRVSNDDVESRARTLFSAIAGAPDKKETHC